MFIWDYKSLDVMKKIFKNLSKNKILKICINIFMIKLYFFILLKIVVKIIKIVYEKIVYLNLN